MEKTLKAIKTVGNIVISIGVGAIADNAIKPHIPADVKGFKRFCVSVGAVVLSSVVVDKTVEHIDKQVENVVNLAKELKKKPENNELETIIGE